MYPYPLRLRVWVSLFTPGIFYSIITCTLTLFQSWLAEVKEYAQDAVTVVLVGNKVDLAAVRKVQVCYEVYSELKQFSVIFT